ncbi:hypothetical protein [Streptomyces sp. NPDC051001]
MKEHRPDAEPREPYAPRRAELDPFKPVIDQMLPADLDAPRASL